MIYDKLNVFHFSRQGNYSTKVDAVWKPRRIKLTVIRSSPEENAASVYIKYSEAFCFSLCINRYQSRLVCRRVWDYSKAEFLRHFCFLFVIGLRSNTGYKLRCFDGGSRLANAVMKAKRIGCPTRRLIHHSEARRLTSIDLQCAFIHRRITSSSLPSLHG